MIRDELDVYAVVRRLLELRDQLHDGPKDFAAIAAHAPGDYTDDKNGKRQFRRDLKNLAALGYSIKRHLRPLRWSIDAGTHLLSDEDIHALVHIREAFTHNHPLGSHIARLLSRLTRDLSAEQRRLWQQQPVLRAQLNPAIDYSDCTACIQFLEAAITQRRQITFLYHARGRDVPLRHERLDPYEIEYTDRHFYLLAFSYRYGSILPFRIDRIVQDKQQDSPLILPGRQQLRRKQKPIVFTYRLPASFADGGVSERFTILSTRLDARYVTVEASDTSEFRIVRTLLGYGEHARLLDGPPTLLERMREAVALMFENYAMPDDKEGKIAQK